MNGTETSIESAEATIAGQKVKITGANLNTLFTILGFIVLCLVAWVLWQHQGETREMSKAFVDSIKEQTAAQKEATVVAREQNCLISVPQDRRDPELCRRLAR